MLLIDKPKGMTSHDVVGIVRKYTHEKRVGHAGTLDPNATGLLIVGVGREETKKLGELTKNTDKTYEAEIFIGESRDTDDVEGKITSKNEQIIPSIKDVQNVLKKFTGVQEQIPPSFSAIKLKGKKAYDLARKQIPLALAARKVTIHSLKLIDYDYPILKVICEVSSGTYIRSIARDIGKELGTGGYLLNLKRTKIGKYDLKDAIKLESLAKTK
jgi:tRNA pseudouridine55 synthase